MKDSANPYQIDKIAEAFRQSNASAIYGGRQKNPEGFEQMTSKMVRGEQTNAAIEDQDSVTNRDHDPFLKSSISKSIERIRDNRNILELLPDAKLAIEIIISTILSPKDMSTPTLTFKLDSRVFDHKAAVLSNYLADYFKNTYKLEEKLEKILWEILGTNGAYVTAILPETAIDYMINSNAEVSVESIRSAIYDGGEILPPMGYLGVAVDGATVSTENMSLLDFATMEIKKTTNKTLASTVIDSELGLSAIDNFDALKSPALRDKLTRQASSAAIQARRNTVNDARILEHRVATMESLQVIKPSEHRRTQKEKADLAKLYPDRNFITTPILRVRDRDSLQKQTVGHPTVLKIPTESCIPVYSPSDVSSHIGYFVAIDPAGNPIRLSELDNMYRMLQTSSNAATGGTGVMSYLLQQSANANSPANLDISKMHVSEGLSRASYIYQELVEKQLLERIALGSVGTGYQLGNLEVPMMLMLSRSLAKKQTQLLYVPADVMSYIAVDHDEFGLGKTLLDDTKMIASLRSMNMIVNSIASSKNAITRRVLDIALDPAEKNPQKAVKMLVQEYVKGTQGEYPLSNNPLDQINYLQMAGVQIRTQDHPRLPNTNFGVDYIDNQYKPIDTTYDEYLKRLHIQGIGIPVEVLEAAGSADFATQVVLANALTARRVNLLSRLISSGLSEFIRLYTYNSAPLMDGLVNLIKTNNIQLRNTVINRVLTSEEIALHAIRSLSVALPIADTGQIKEQKEAYDIQYEFYEQAIKNFYSEEWLSEEEIGRLGGMEQITKTSKYIVAYFMRRWQRNNGVATELFDLISVDENGRPMIDFGDERNDHLNGLAKALFPIMKSDMKRSGDVNAALDAFEESLTNPPGGEGDSGNYDGGGMDYNDNPTDTVDADNLDGLDTNMDEETIEEDPEAEPEEDPEAEADKPAEE